MAMTFPRISDNPDPQGRREENDMHAMFALPAMFREVRVEHPDWKPQPCFLLAVRRAVEHQEGHQDRAREDAVFQLYLRHNGLAAFGRMMDVDEKTIDEVMQPLIEPRLWTFVRKVDYKDRLERSQLQIGAVIATSPADALAILKREAPREDWSAVELCAHKGPFALYALYDGRIL